MKRRVGRRAVLRGLAYGGAISVGSPLFECMLDSSGKAMADGAPLPKRFGVFFWGNGVRMAKYLPSTTGAYTLTETLAPLMNVKDYVSIVSGYDIKTGNERGHHAG